MMSAHLLLGALSSNRRVNQHLANVTDHTSSAKTYEMRQERCTTMYHSQQVCSAPFSKCWLIYTYSRHSSQNMVQSVP